MVETVMAYRGREPGVSEKKAGRSGMRCLLIQISLPSVPTFPLLACKDLESLPVSLPYPEDMWSHFQGALPHIRISTTRQEISYVHRTLLPVTMLTHDTITVSFTYIRMSMLIY